VRDRERAIARGPEGQGRDVLIGKVIGTVVTTRKDEKLLGLKFLVVEGRDPANRSTKSYVVAVDGVGAGLGEHVLYATGSSARQTALTEGRPADAVIMAVIDEWDVEGTIVFRKTEHETAPA